MTTTIAEKAVVSLMEQDSFDIRTIESKMDLAKVILTHKQDTISIFHRFGGGLYIREAHYEKQHLIVGQEHVSDHMNVLLRGSIKIVSGDGEDMVLTAPHMFLAKAGSKVGLTIEDVVWQNIYVTDSTDVEYLESTLFRTPDFFKEYTEQRILKKHPLHQEDRDDFQCVLNESGWTQDMVEAMSKYRGDCIPLPDGTYTICSGPSPIEGRGMFSTAVVPKGTFLAPMRLGGMRTPAGYLVNHSKNPNCYAVKNELGDMFLVTSREIGGMVGGDLDEEITLDYRQVMQLNGMWKELENV